MLSEVFRHSDATLVPHNWLEEEDVQLLNYIEFCVEGPYPGPKMIEIQSLELYKYPIGWIALGITS